MLFYLYVDKVQPKLTEGKSNFSECNYKKIITKFKISQSRSVILIYQLAFDKRNEEVDKKLIADDLVSSKERVGS